MRVVRRAACLATMDRAHEQRHVTSSWEAGPAMVYPAVNVSHSLQNVPDFVSIATHCKSLGAGHLHPGSQLLASGTRLWR